MSEVRPRRHSFVAVSGAAGSGGNLLLAILRGQLIIGLLFGAWFAFFAGALLYEARQHRASAPVQVDASQPNQVTDSAEAGSVDG